MMRNVAIIAAIILAMTARAQETVESMVPDSALHLPTLNNIGQMPSYINRWTMSHFMGYHDWDLHKGMNISLGASVFAGLGGHTPSGAGFAQNVNGMYAASLTDKLSLAFGGYFLNADWGGFNLRDAGLNAVLGYRFNEHWESYLYGQKSLMEPKTGWPFYDMHELGDRIGAAIRYNFNPSISVQVRFEYDTNRNTLPAFRRQNGEKPGKAPF